MRQINLLPAGCHQSDQMMVFASEKSLIFASKLALYVLNAQTFIVERILSVQSRAILSMHVNPHRNNLVACSGVDGVVCVWDINSEEIVVKETHPCEALAWDPHDPNRCAVVCNHPKLALHLWDTRPEINSMRRVYVHDSDNVSSTIIRWNPHFVDQVAMGCSNGIVYINDLEKKKMSSLKIPDRTLGIVDIQWDPLSAVYMIVAYQSFISLWDTETMNEVHAFEKQSTGISCLAWMDWTAGNFVSSNLKTGVVKFWNASQKNPLESVRVHSAGIISLTFAVGGSSRMFCSSTDGSVILFNVKNRQVEFKSQGGHTDTIFDCTFHPQSPDTIASCSFDGTVKVWNVPDLSLTNTLHGTECIIYSCSWSPDSKKIVGSTISGEVIIWDVESSRILAKYKPHSKASYCVAWNQEDPSLILSTSADGSAAVMEIATDDLSDIASPKNQRIGSRRFGRGKRSADDYSTPKDITKFSHGYPVYGCSWGAQRSLSKYFATGCQDGMVRIFGFPGSCLSCLYSFSGHSARSFSVVWSPLIPGLLASGSDDKKILVWEVSLPKEPVSPKQVKFVRQLVGHKSNIRALSWNYEQRQLLLSGSWDSTIRIWNVVSAECLQVIFDHVADVYSITSHPLRPFTYISCSRDSTMRVWEIEGFTLRLRLKALVNGSLGDVVDDDVSEMDWNGDSLDPALYGSASKSLANQFSTSTFKYSHSEPNGANERADQLVLAEIYKRFYDFFCGSNGSVNFWECVVDACKRRADPSANPLSSNQAKDGAAIDAGITKAYPEHQIVNFAKASARKLELVKSSTRRGDISGKAEEQLRQAALVFAQTGEFLKYCSIMVEIGDWMAALAMAPCVSHDYWRYLAKGYALFLRKKKSENCIPYLIATGQDRDAVDFYLDRKESLSAMVVSKMSESRTDQIPSLGVTGEDDINFDNFAYSWSGEVEHSCRDRTGTEEQESRKMVHQVVLQLVEANMSLAKPISAAAHLIGVQNYEAAVQLLVTCGEYDMAFATARCFSVNAKGIIKAMAEKAEYLKDVDLALTILNQLPEADAERERELLFARSAPLQAISTQSEGKDEEGETQKIKPGILERASEAEAIGQDDEAIILFIEAGSHKDAVRVGLLRLEKFMYTPFQLSPIAKTIFGHLKNIRGDSLDPSLRRKFLCYMAWFGSYAAIQQGFWTTSWSMLKVLGANVTAEFPIPRSILSIQELCVRVQCRNEGALPLMDNILIELKHDKIIPDQVSKINGHLESIRTLLQESVTDSSRGLLGGGVQSMSQTALSTCSLYGSLTRDIESEIRELQSIMGLPTLPSTLSDPPAGVSKIHLQSYGHAGPSSIHGLPTIIQGSLLPVANQTMKKLVSWVSERKVQGAVVLLEDDATFMPLNEAIMWKKVNPYSPLFTGAFLNIY